MIFPDQLVVLLEPTAECNIRCRHCYHADTKYDMQKMTEETLSSFLRVLSPNYKRVRIIWHGGEPLLMGIDFYEKSYALFKENAEKYGTKFDFGIQTNGTLINEEFAELFKKTDTTVSVSYDGPYNGVLRQETARTERAIELLQSYGTKVVCLSTVSTQSVMHLTELYGFFKEKKLDVKFNPVFASGAAIRHQEYVVSKEAWTEAFIQLFDYWLLDKNCNICLASCENVLERFIGPCKMGCPTACLFQYIAIDAYGNLYPCGRLIRPEFLLCNVKEVDDVRQAYLTENYLKLKDQAIKRVSDCKNCKWFSKCRGGCNATASINGTVENRNEFDCYFSNKVFEYSEKRLNEANTVKNPRALKILNK